MQAVKIYTAAYCPFCRRAKSLLQAKGIPYEEIDVSDTDAKQALKQRTGWPTVPQIFIGDRMIGGFEELAEMDRRGELDTV